MAKEKPLVDQHYILEKFPGKGGWTYASIPEVLQDRIKPFGWVTVKGTIDGFPLKNYKLMPMGNGRLFLPVKADVRKKIGKQAGDQVHVVLFADDSLVEVPGEFTLCLKDAPDAERFFMDLTDGQRKAYVDWIYAAVTENTRVQRIVSVIKSLEQGKKYLE